MKKQTKTPSPSSVFPKGRNLKMVMSILFLFFLNSLPFGKGWGWASFGQNNNQQLGPLWDKDQPSKNIFENLNYNNVGIGTILPSEKLHVKGNLKVEGKIISDSAAHFMNNVTIDSSLEVKGETAGFTHGDGSFWWKPGYPIPFPQDLVSVSTGYFIVMGGGKKNISALTAMGINTQTPQSMLHINDAIQNHATYMQVTNNTTGMLSTTDGLKVGIDATGIAEIRQQENLPINFFTNNTQQVTIIANGSMGIGLPNPITLLHVNGTITSNTLSGAGSSSVSTSNNEGIVIADNLGSEFTKLKFSGNASDILLGTGTFGNLTNAITNTAWVLGGNPLATNLDKLGATFPGTNLNIYAGSNTQQSMFIDGSITSTFGNVGIGKNFTNALQRLDVDSGNIDVNTPTQGYMIGDQYVLRHKGDTTNIFAGAGAGASNTTGFSNTFVGKDAGKSNIDGRFTTAIGYQALYSLNSFVGGNVAVGAKALFSNQAYGGVAVGFSALYFNTTGCGNTGIGENALIFNDTGERNVGVGEAAGYHNVNGNNNTLVGTQAGFGVLGQSYSNNSFFGYHAGISNTTGSNNTYLGYLTGGSNTLTNAAAVGANAFVTQDNSLVLGSINGVNGATADIKVGIGTTAPNATLDIVGTGLINGVAITSDASLKTNVSTLKNSLDKINNLQGVSFEWVPSMRTDTFMFGKHYGFIAQQVDAVLPDVVRIKNDGISTIAYHEIVPVVVEAIKQLDSAVTTLQNKPGVSGTGTTNFLTKWSGAKAVTGSQFTDDGINTGINTLNPLALFNVPATAPAVSNAGIFSLTGTAGTTFNTGVQGISNVSGGSQNYGVIGNAAGTGFNFGGNFAASGTGNNYGIYASVPSRAGVAGYFDGDVFINSPTFGGFTVSPSDAILKQNLSPINDPLAIISQLHPESFYYDTANTFHLRLSSQKQYGFTAQDVETLLPELVYTTQKPAEIDASGNITAPAANYKSLNYQAFIAILTKGMQQQEVRIASLESIVRSCCSTNTRTNESGNRQHAELTSPAAILYLNIPNPFTDETTINYFVPENAGTAIMTFYDETGSAVKEVELLKKGNNSLVLSTSKLASGVYSYGLIVDGRVIETKTMVKTK